MARGAAAVQGRTARAAFGSRRCRPANPAAAVVAPPAAAAWDCLPGGAAPRPWLPAPMPARPWAAAGGRRPAPASTGCLHPDSGIGAARRAPRPDTVPPPPPTALPSRCRSCASRLPSCPLPGPGGMFIYGRSPAPCMAPTRDGVWTERDTELCREARASGMVYNKATGKPLTFAETQAQYDEYAPVRAGLVDYETFRKDRIEVRPFEDGPAERPAR